MNLSNFVESLSELLLQADLTPSELAKQIGCGKGTISRYLHEQKVPDVGLLVRMADFFNCSTDYLLGRETEKYIRVFTNPCPTFQERLPKLCKDLKITKYQLQKQTGIAESAIYAWQNGTNKPCLDNLLKIADTFDCSLDFVLGRSTL